jgi:hypothetical protein
MRYFRQPFTPLPVRIKKDFLNGLLAAAALMCGILLLRTEGIFQERTKFMSRCVKYANPNGKVSKCELHASMARFNAADNQERTA